MCLYKNKNAPSDSFNQLRKDLIRGKFPAGPKIKIMPLKEEYGIGISPLREALHRFSEYGLLEQTNQRGFRFPELSIDQLLYTTNLRVKFEEMALKNLSSWPIRIGSQA